MSEVTLRPQPSVLPRPNSLFLPDIRETTTSLIRPNSYSPFPALPGTNADPHNLDRFLLPPDDPSWLYHLAAASDTAVLRQAMTERVKDEPTSSNRPVKKVRSFSMLGQTSPLSRPPINAQDEAAPRETRQRKRSNSLDSTSSPRNGSQESLDFTPELISEVKKGSGGKKTLRQALYFRKKSALQTPEPIESSRGGSSPLRTSRTTASSSSASSVEESDPVTPSSTRSNSDHSEKSSLSSASSSEGVKTPSEAAAQQLEIDIAAGKLAVALAAAGERQRRKGNWKGWLSGKRASKVASAPGSGASTPSDTSSEPQVQVQTTSEPVVKVPQATSTPSPKPASPAPAAISQAEQAINRALTTEQLRRITLRKLGQLRAPSPHPLALSLKRQYSNLPEEVACSIQSGQKVFPMSVNVHDSTSGLNPMQAGLVTALAVKTILTKLERGECPEGTMMSRLSSDPMTVPRPRGVLDFVDRPPFEERNIVFFPNGTLSPISMARPGYGVWDLDFSPYMLALSTVDGPPSNSRLSLSRTDAGLLDGVESKATTAAVATPSPDSEAEEMLVSPVPLTLSLDDDFVGSDRAKRSSAEVTKAPISSFRNVKRPSISTLWDVSSEEEEDDDGEEEETDDDDDSPLATIFTKRTSSSSALAPVRPVSLQHERSKSTPTANRVSLSFIEDEEKKRRILDEVARARERRQANLTGETERRAEAEKHQRRSIAGPPSSYRRSSAVDVSRRKPSGGDITPPIQSAASTPPLSPPSPPKASRRRTQSSYDMKAPKVGTTRTPSAPEGSLSASKRYHSFYEAPKVASPQLPPPAHLSTHPFHMAQTYPTPYGYGHPGMQAYPTMSPSASMVFPPSGYLQPMMTHPHQSMSHSYSSAQINAAMYHQMQTQASRTSLQLAPARPGASHRSQSAFASTANLASRSPRSGRLN